MTSLKMGPQGNWASVRIRPTHRSAETLAALFAAKKIA
jgi:hypothetical protein